MTQLLRVQNFMVSKDGFGAGEGQSLEAPFGQAEARGGRAPNLPADLASWAFATASWPGRTEPGGSRGLDDYFTRDFARNIGAEIMGRNKFGPQRGPWENLDWKGWWGGRPALPHPRVRPHPSSPTELHARRHHVPLPRCDARGGVAASEGRRRGEGRTGWRRRRHRSGVPRGGSHRHHPCRRRAGRDRPRGATLDLPRGPARPVPPRIRAQRQRRVAPALLAAVTTANSR